MPIPPQQRTQQSLSNDQQSLIEETIAQYDIENLTEDEAKNIVQTFAEAGIRPGQAMEDAIAQAGGDAKEIGDIAGAQGPKGNGPPPPPPSGGNDDIESLEVSSIVEYLEELMAEKDLTELSETDKEEMYTQVIEHFGLNQGENLVNLTI